MFVLNIFINERQKFYLFVISSIALSTPTLIDLAYLDNNFYLYWLSIFTESTTRSSADWLSQNSPRIYNIYASYFLIITTLLSCLYFSFVYLFTLLEINGSTFNVSRISFHIVAAFFASISIPIIFGYDSLFEYQFNSHDVNSLKYRIFSDVDSHFMWGWVGLFYFYIITARTIISSNYTLNDDSEILLKIAALQRENEDLLSAKAGLTRSLVNLRSAHDEKEDDLKSQSLKIDSLERELLVAGDIIRGKDSDLATKLQHAQNKIIEVESQNTALRSEHHKLLEQLADAQNKADKTEELQEQVQEIASLRLGLAIKKKEADQASVSLEKATKKIENLTEQIHDLTDQKTELEDKLANNESSDHTALKRRIRQLETAKKTLRENKSKLEDELAVLEQKLAEIEANGPQTRSMTMSNYQRLCNAIAKQFHPEHGTANLSPASMKLARELLPAELDRNYAKTIKALKLKLHPDQSGESKLPPEERVGEAVLAVITQIEAELKQDA